MLTPVEKAEGLRSQKVNFAEQIGVTERFLECFLQYKSDFWLEQVKDEWKNTCKQLTVLEEIYKDLIDMETEEEETYTKTIERRSHDYEGVTYEDDHNKDQYGRV